MPCILYVCARLSCLCLLIFLICEFIIFVNFGERQVIAYSNSPPIIPEAPIVQILNHLMLSHWLLRKLCSFFKSFSLFASFLIDSSAFFSSLLAYSTVAILLVTPFGEIFISKFCNFAYRRSIYFSF